VISGKAPQCKAIRALPVLFRQWIGNVVHVFRNETSVNF
jgi:hypothetical protein